ncbi:rRNA maturation RNase YbeY [Arthrobacter russicus]|uniref:Endoribonuclease YbeY n=1 Tax=Arthrobacter russicus TaxID=172040 RepID=A0ABU1J7W4_9MICC|nr:rRNA maturation RNase YbeY [Arthrobacter russicus]MDN5667973.1 rRNA maturation RNase YbeY [Renibacterium salmoninarum]MDR6267946.1 putative rRNA maturation factor [Arthrobacter russicus]
MSIEINNESGVESPDEELVRLARFVFEQLHLHPQTELSIILADREAMEKLHLEWMDEPGATDVLSFPMDELRPGTIARPAPAGLLGDIVICPQVAQEQADAGGHSLEDELLLLATHGLLHLLGFDHEEPEEKAEMFGLQRQLLSSFLGRPAPAETTT